MSNVPLGNFARTFKDGDKSFYYAIGFQCIWQFFFFFMISELVHGCWKGFIHVPEGKLGSGSRGFEFHLQKAIAPETLAVILPSLSVLKSTVEKFRQQNSKSFLLATVEARKESN